MKNLCLLLVLLLAGPLVAQTSDDELFGDEATDIEAPQGPAVDLSALLTKGKPSFVGNIKVSGVLFAGWTDLPNPSDLNKNFDKGFGYDLTSTVTLDARPDPSFHWAATLNSGIAPGLVSWSVPSISSMYVDYTALDKVFFTVGKFGLGWGVGRLFAVNDLLAGIANKLSVKAFAPLGPLGLTGVIMLPPGATMLTQVNWAGQAEASLGPFNLAVSGSYSSNTTPQVDAWVKSNWRGFDVFAEGKLLVPTNATMSVSGLAGIFWEGLEPVLRLQAEWMVDGTAQTGNDQSVAVAASLARIPGTNIKPSAKVTYAVIDGSGQVVVGFEADPMPHVHVTLGLPVSWGALTSRWVAATLKDYHETWALALKVDLTGGF